MNSEIFSPLETAASSWLLRHEDGLTPAEERELQSWLAADQAHRAAYERMQHAWRTLDRLPEVVPVAVQSRRWLLPTVLAMAAALAVAATIGYRAHLRSSPFDTTVSTAIGAFQMLELPDGSTIRLNTDTALIVHYTKTERRILLSRGEAHFAVAKNPSRPFLVDAAGISVRAVGTAFDVRLRAQSVDVLVTEGKVAVLPPQGAGSDERGVKQNIQPSAFSPQLSLGAGEKISVPLDSPAKPAIIPVAAAEIEQATAWHDQRLKFDATPLSAVVTEFNRYNIHQLVIDDPVLGEQRFGGTFRPERYEVLLGLLEENFDVVAERQADRTILRRRAP